jgi:hypothetical protein
MSLLGTFAEVGLAQVLRTLSKSGKTGLLLVSGPDANATCHFFEGALLHAKSDSYVGDDAVVALFGWDDGQWEFVPEVPSPTPNVTRTVEVLIQMGERSGQALHRMRGYYDSDQIVFQWADNPPVEAHYGMGASDWKLLRLLDGIRTFGEVIRASGVPRLSAQLALYELTAAGFLERIDVVKTLVTRRSPPFAGFSILAPSASPELLVELDQVLLQEWQRVGRFARGVERIRINSLRGRSRNFRVTFRPGIDGVVQLPDNAFEDLAVGEGERVQVRPIGSRVRAPKA